MEGNRSFVFSLNIESGRVIADRFKILGTLGSGGMGVVVKALDLELQEEIALKLLHPHLAEDQTTFARFINELKVARNLSHPNIVRLHDIGRSKDGVSYISMELVDGESLKDRLAENVDSAKNMSFNGDMFDAIATELYQIVSGVAYAHGRGIIHRDIKPGNILITSTNEVKIADFGMARFLGIATSFTQTGQSIGTPDYMSPEQIRGETLDPRCDVYSLGIVAYEMVTGVKPFSADSSVAVAFKHLNDPLPAILEENKNIPDWYCQLIRRACSKKKDDRFADAGKMSACLLSGLQQSKSEYPENTTVISALVPVGSSMMAEKRSREEVSLSPVDGFSSKLGSETPILDIELIRSRTQDDKGNRFGLESRYSRGSASGDSKFTYKGVVLGALLLVPVVWGVLYWLRTGMKLQYEHTVNGGNVGNQASSVAPLKQNSISKNREADSSYAPSDSFTGGGAMQAQKQSEIVSLREELMSSAILSSASGKKEVVEAVKDNDGSGLKSKNSIQSGASKSEQAKEVAAVVAKPSPPLATAEKPLQVEFQEFVSLAGHKGDLFSLEEVSGLRWSAVVKGVEDKRNEALSSELSGSLSVNLFSPKSHRVVSKLPFSMSREVKGEKVNLRLSGSLKDMFVSPGSYRFQVQKSTEVIGSKEIVFYVKQKAEQDLRPSHPEKGSWSLPRKLRQIRKNRSLHNAPFMGPRPFNKGLPPARSFTRPPKRSWELEGPEVMHTEEDPQSKSSGLSQIVESRKEEFVGKIMMNEGRSVLRLSLKLYNAGAEIHGRAEIADLGVFDVEGRKSSENLTLLLKSKELRLRLSGVRSGDFVRGRFVNPRDRQSGHWRVRLISSEVDPHID